MNKHFTLALCLFLWAAFTAHAQCPLTPQTFSSQAQIDAFPTNFPNCHNIGVKIVITGANITNLNGLNGLETTTNSIEIIGNPMLTSLSGLSNLTSIDVELKIDDNDALPNFSGLENLTWVGGHFSIEGNAVLTTLNGIGAIPSLGSYLNIAHNPLLTDITALNSITEVGPSYFNAFLQISNNNSLASVNGLNLITETGSFFFLGSNPVLTTVNGLNGLTTVNGEFAVTGNPLLSNLNAFTSLATVDGDFIIDVNSALTNLDEFDNLASITGSLVIASNSSLSDCVAEGICDFLAGPGTAVISNNANGCNSVTQVEIACAAAPVELVFFRGRLEEESVLLSWQTASEKDNDYFVVEYGTDGKHFQPLGKVDGNGNSSTSKNYQFRHQRPSKGPNYYRLTQVDFDGKSEHFNIVGVFVEEADALRIFPNPTTGPVIVTGNAPERFGRVLDFAGQVVLEKNLSESNLLDLSNQPKGVYFIEIQTGNQKTTKRVVKE